MKTSEIIAKYNILSAILLKNGDRELSKDLKARIMASRIAFNKVKTDFDTSMRDFAASLLTPEIQEMQSKLDKSDDENAAFQQAINAANTTYQTKINEKGAVEVSMEDFRLNNDEYNDIVDVNSDNDAEINGIKLKAGDYLELIHNLFCD